MNILELDHMNKITNDINIEKFISSPLIPSSTKLEEEEEEETAINVEIILLSTNAYIPKRLTKWSAGLDLQSAYDYQLLAHDKCYIKTDLIICCPKGTYGRIAPKSSLAHKYHIDVGAGVIDEDYRGNILVLLFNHSDYPIFIQKGDPVAQIIFEKIMYPNVKIVTSLNETNRADRGLGFTHTNLI